MDKPTTLSRLPVPVRVRSAILKIKMLWKDDKDPKYQSIETIRPIGAKVIPLISPLPNEPLADTVENDDDSVPF